MSLQPYRSLCFFCGLALRMLNIYKKLQARAHWIKSGSWCQVPAQRKLSGTSSTAQHTHIHAGTPKGICSLWRWAAPTNQIKVAQLCEPLLLFTVSEKFTLLASCRHVAFQFSSAYEQCKGGESGRRRGRETCLQVKSSYKNPFNPTLNGRSVNCWHFGLGSAWHDDGGGRRVPGGRGVAPLLRYTIAMLLMLLLLYRTCTCCSAYRFVLLLLLLLKCTRL